MSVDHTRAAELQLNQILSELKDAETGQRGFLLTGLELFLEPYNHALTSWSGEFATLRRLTADNPDQQRGLCNQTIYVAAPNYHLLIERNRSLSLSIDEPVHHSRPAIDVLFESAAYAYGPAVAGLVLSGANQDGAEGLCQIRQAGGVAIVQAPATASSPMMPETAMRRVGPSAHVVRLVDLGAFLARLVGAKTRGGDLL